MERSYYTLALTKVKGLGSVTGKKLITEIGTAEGVFKQGKKSLMAVVGIGKKLVDGIVSFDRWDEVEREIERAKDLGIRILSIDDNVYPERLKEIYDPPLVLYMRGKIMTHDESAVAVVGSRHATTYGSLATERIARGLAENGITVVSGMARGIDSLAHRGALDGGGRTIAVLGSGVDVIYPPEHKRLYTEISERGAVVSEFPPGTSPEAQNFPRRNRIISGLSLGVVIVEASENSGALITARQAMEQNREVFAVPGNITSLRSKGTHRLIQEGAKLVESVEDILKEFVYLLKNEGTIESKTRNAHQNIKESLSAEEKKVFDQLKTEPVYIDSIIDETRLPSEQVLGILLQLELKGLVKQIAGKNFVLNQM
jgi:DNA processing protein